MQQYDAFISYRHQDVDNAIVEALQNKLERLKKRDGKYLSVCRDRTDLSATNDLDADIKKKLENSRYLIVLCTPGYSESPWCIKELRYFRQLHGDSNANILPILLDGEPKAAFPDELLWENQIGIAADGHTFTVRTKTEPLAADIRGNSRKQMLRLLRTEYLRVAAPLLGKNYDDLYRRQRRWQWMLWGSIGGIVMLGLILFALYNRIMLNQIDKEHQTMLANESRRLAEAAEEEIDGGNSNMALLLALEALPKDLDDPERPIIPEAETALRSAIYSRLIQGEVDLIQNITRIDFPSSNWQGYSAFFDNFSKLYVEISGSLWIYDTANGKLLLEAPMGISGYYQFNADMTHILVFGSDSYGGPLYRYDLYEVASGQRLYHNVFESSAGHTNDTTAIWDLDENICYFLSVSDDRDPIFLDAVYADGTPAPERQVSSEQLSQWEKKMYTERGDRMSQNSVDYDGSDGPLTEKGLRYQAEIEKHWKDGYHSAHISEDEKLLVIHESYYGSCMVYPLDSADRRSVKFDGTCVVDAQHKRLYIVQESSLYIYSYQTANEAGSIFIDRISNDGQLCMKQTYCIDGIVTDHPKVISGETPTVLQVWDYKNFSEPLLELFYDESYYLTLDMRYVLIISKKNTLQLWHVYQGLVTEIPLQEGKPFLPCVSADGSLLAVVCYEQQTVDVYSSDGARILQIPIPMQHNYNKDNYSQVMQLEFEGSKLLITCSCEGTSGYTQIWDIPSGDPPLIIEDYSLNENEESQDYLLTSDGLLFCVGRVFGDAVDTIYDIETGEIIFRQTAFFRYDEDSQLLIYAPVGPQFPDMATIHAAYRDETGMFRDVYTFETEIGSFSLRYAVQAIDTEYFLLNGSNQRNVHETATGQRAMTIRAGNSENLFYIADGVIYFTGYHPDTAGCAFPLMDLPELVEMAKSYLTSDTGIRSLTNAEKAKFYID